MGPSSAWQGGERSDGSVERKIGKTQQYVGLGLRGRGQGRKKDLGLIALGTETREGPMCKRMPGHQAPQTVCLFYGKNYLGLVVWRNQKCHFLAIWSHYQVCIGVKRHCRRK